MEGSATGVAASSKQFTHSKVEVHVIFSGFTHALGETAKTATPHPHPSGVRSSRHLAA